MTQPSRQPRIGILSMAGNAWTTLHRFLDRIPATFRQKTTKAFISADPGEGPTCLVGSGGDVMAPECPPGVIRNKRNLGNGGNQKVDYNLHIILAAESA